MTISLQNTHKKDQGKEEIAQVTGTPFDISFLACSIFFI